MVVERLVRGQEVDGSNLFLRRSAEVTHVCFLKVTHPSAECPVDTVSKIGYSDNQIHEENEYNGHGSFAQFCRLR